ncbi:glycosyltransferase [Bradyrhizobium sp. 173]|uniref:glycosyltransferase n=1 Tax=Bradyrhizobium sp. 173 TaxID=2782644 RepID=UPI001FF9B661|nr:glycosyltransferase [Bradyrhizobium sp. 173]MCK1564118.1 glycosyltransferase [Bradyrhizobium sp. 173]
MKIIVWHNIMWARYKAAVFSALHEQAINSGIDIRICQIAETESDRVALSPVDSSWHAYPYLLLFKGSYSNIPHLRLLKELVKRAWRDDADVTILTGYEKPEVCLQALTLFLRGKKFAWFCDSTAFDQPPNLLKSAAKRILFQMADGIFCYGERSSQYVQLHGVKGQRIFIRRQAAALPKDYLSATALARRKMLAPTPLEPRYLYVGRLSAEKSLDRLLRAFPKVIQRHANARLVIVGRGPQEKELRELASELGLASHVQFAGAKFDDALVDEYLHATCVVLPSYSEPWGLVINESLSYGCPAVVSDRCGCVPELIDDGRTGYVFEWESLPDLEQKLLDAPETFRDVSAIAQACLARISSFTPEAAAQGILDGATTIWKE